MSTRDELIAEARQLVYEEWIERDGQVVDRAQIIQELLALMDRGQ